MVSSTIRANQHSQRTNEFGPPGGVLRPIGYVAPLARPTRPTRATRLANAIKRFQLIARGSSQN
ncbi:hypothetical protein SADFL11_00010820 [Roseibium alexandrii DFL-11]|uniref:Uncharacterized protein n=1 Tax=Roseibium alexandrii (strain DSM 17067 / NCIMB 14079 / DFL-11) TaxID=244592 RepID=A0A5E8UWC4_ROSAD|nr:hypothetical protein SADFL11_00010820 [Roseibium alexandrii DFL-11]